MRQPPLLPSPVLRKGFIPTRRVTLKHLLLVCGALLLLIARPASAAPDEDLDTLLTRATVKISHDSSTATGWVLTLKGGEQRVLVTAAHVLENTRADETEVIFHHQEEEGVYRRVVLKLALRKDGKPLWTRHPTADVAVLRIVPPRDADLPAISPEMLASDESLRRLRVHPGEAVACLGFPHRNEGGEAGFPILRAGAIGTYPLVPTARTKTFYFSGNTFEGDSGGPVYLTRSNSTNPEKGEVRLILGLVSGQMFLDEEAKMIYGTVKVRHRLGLAIIVHASFIRETLELLR